MDRIALLLALVALALTFWSGHQREVAAAPRDAGLEFFVGTDANRRTYWLDLREVCLKLGESACKEIDTE